MPLPTPYNTGLTEEQIAEAFRRAINDMTDDQITALLAEKVDKQEGFSLMSEADKSKLDGLENYDDANIKDDISGVSNQAVINKTTLGYQAKNLLKNTAVSGSHNGVQYTVNADGSITTGTGTIAETVAFLVVNSFTFKAGVSYILSGAPNDGTTATRISVVDKSGVETQYQDKGSGVVVKFDTNTTYNIRIRFGSGGTTLTESKTFRPMIRYAEITDDTYEPYKPSVEERLNDVTDQIFGIGMNIPSGADLNDYINAGIYHSENSTKSASLLNCPNKSAGFRLEVCGMNMKGRFIQKLYPNVTNVQVFARTYSVNGFSPWFKFAGEAIAT